MSGEAAGVNHESVKHEINLAVEFFSREIGNQGLLYLLNEELEELNGRAGRLTTAKQEIEKWADIESGTGKNIIVMIYYHCYFHSLLFNVVVVVVVVIVTISLFLLLSLLL
tara:strand:+ start:175 stop:507 length:333 start_codon:yes stop_codon:yes gene_type:complete